MDIKSIRNGRYIGKFSQSILEVFLKSVEKRRLSFFCNSDKMANVEKLK